MAATSVQYCASAAAADWSSCSDCASAASSAALAAPSARSILRLETAASRWRRPSFSSLRCRRDVSYASCAAAAAGRRVAPPPTS